jgi:hypothetical protein
MRRIDELPSWQRGRIAMQMILGTLNNADIFAGTN